MSENILPTEEETQRKIAEAVERFNREGEQRRKLYELNVTPGMRIIPSGDIPDGYRRIEGMDIFISLTNYEELRTLSAEELLSALAFLKSQ